VRAFTVDMPREGAAAGMAGEVHLPALYAKSESENMSPITLKEIRRALKI
jgi:hypothetical protein